MCSPQTVLNTARLCVLEITAQQQASISHHPYQYQTVEDCSRQSDEEVMEENVVSAQMERPLISGVPITRPRVSRSPSSCRH
jgi:hypothetical protein